MPAGSSEGSTDSSRCSPRPRPQYAVTAQRANAAQELHARAAAERLRRANDDRANRAGARDMRAAAGRDVEVRDLDQSKCPVARGFLAQRQPRRFLGVGEADR